MGSPEAKCDDCGSVWVESELLNAHDRINGLILDSSPGEAIVIPSGLCPECFACAYPVEGEAPRVEDVLDTGVDDQGVE